VRSAVARILALLALVVVATAATYAKGVDVSNYQGTIDWLSVSGAGYSFAFAKASEGTTFTDVTYALNRSGTNGIGMRLGAYHFARPTGSNAAQQTASAIAQADHFVDIAQPKGGDLPPVVDLETNGGLKPPGLVTWTQAWLDEVQARTGLEALIYASPAFWKSSLSDTSAFALAGHRLWIAHWTKSAAPMLPASDWGGAGWAFWQWSDCQTVAGIKTKCVDADRVNSADATTYAVKAMPAGVPAISTAPSVVGTIRAGQKLAAVPGQWTGGKAITFGYQWQSCDGAGQGCAPIPGATLETYTPTANDIGHTLVVSVTATSKAGPAAASSVPTTAVASATGVSLPTVVTQPAVAGTVQVGQTLTGTPGTWSNNPSIYDYAWERCDATGANCVPIAGATAAAYTLSPGDAGTTVTLLVTAKNAAGSSPATAAASTVVELAPIPPAVAGSAAAEAGVAGAVVTADGTATVTWQPGAVPVGGTVSLESSPTVGGGTVVSLGLAPTTTLPWPVDIAYAAAPAGQDVGTSQDGKIWTPVGAVTAPPALPAGFLTGAYADTSGVQHVLTRKAAQFKLFAPGSYGDPRLVSRYAPRLRRVKGISVTRLRSGAAVIRTRMSVPSQATILPTHRRVLKPGEFPVAVRVKQGVHHVTIYAVDPYGRRGSFTLSF
jgi:lysozyme